mmetsp:Transcript_58763/g.161249  ORF Transcript_58763/g.161249 Transcript_58763/m.161249 type:complete len:124 (-) Transcript_58763:685-1056(-)
MLPVVLAVRKRLQREVPQVLAALDDEAALDADCWSPPFVVPRAVALPSLVCEVLHPAAHWTGSLSGSEDPDDADDAEPPVAAAATAAAKGDARDAPSGVGAGERAGKVALRQRNVPFPLWVTR